MSPSDLGLLAAVRRNMTGAQMGGFLNGGGGGRFDFFEMLFCPKKSPPRLRWGWRWAEFAQKSTRNPNPGSKLQKNIKL